MGVFSCSLFIISSAGEAWGIFFFEKKERKEKLAIFEGRGLKKWVAFFAEKKRRANDQEKWESVNVFQPYKLLPSNKAFYYSLPSFYNPWFFSEPFA